MSSFTRPLKNAICRVALHPSSLRRTVCTPHSSGFARLASHRFSSACPQYGLSTGCYAGRGVRGKAGSIHERTALFHGEEDSRPLLIRPRAGVNTFAPRLRHQHVFPKSRVPSNSETRTRISRFDATSAAGTCTGTYSSEYPRIKPFSRSAPSSAKRRTVFPIQDR